MASEQREGSGARSSLSKALQERDKQIRRLREEAVQAQKKFPQQLKEETDRLSVLAEQLEHLSVRKEDLKHDVEEKEAELEEVKRVYGLGQSGQNKYQVNLRSQSATIQVMFIDRDSDSAIPVVFSVPPTDDISPMPTLPSTPASLQRFPLSTSVYSTSNTTSSYCSQDSFCSDHMLPEHEALMPSSTRPEVQMVTSAAGVSKFEW
ncbi:hypothetical protein PAMP_012801 [Pampus punctatissimus]